MSDEYIHDDYHPSSADDFEPCEHENWFWSDYWQGYVCDQCGKLDRRDDMCAHLWVTDPGMTWRHCKYCGLYEE